MIIIVVKPFRFVEGRLFNLFCRSFQPKQEKVSCQTIKRDCMKIIYKEEKEKVRADLNEVNLIWVTTDTWTSRRAKSYMSLTAHYVDKNWKMHISILSFRYVPPPHTR